MRAARWYAAGRIQLEELPEPVPSPDQALIAVAWVGLCGSDAEEFHHGPVVTRPPVTLGHEIVGIVERPAADGSGPPVGTPVVVDVVTGCGHCWWCQRHDEGLCPDLVITGFDVDGGLAEYVVARADRLVPVPESLDLRHAVLAEPLAVAVRAVRKAGPLEGCAACIVGGGTIGMLTAQVIRCFGAAQVVVLEPSQHRRALIEGWGVHTAWADNADDRRAALDPWLPDRGPDVVVECSGRPGMPAEALRLARPGGLALLLGVTLVDEPVDTLDLVLREKTVRGSAAHMYDDDVAVAVDLLGTGAVDVSALVTHTFPLAEIDRAFGLLTGTGEQAIKILVDVR